MSSSAEARAEIPEALQSILNELTALQGRPEEAARRYELCQQALRLLPREANPPLWAALQSELGNACQELYDRTGEERYAHEAEAAFRHALEEWQRDIAPADWARTQHNWPITSRRNNPHERS